MDSTPSARLLNTLQTQTSGGSIMLQLHLSPRHSPRGPLPPESPPSGHVGAHQNGLAFISHVHQQPPASCLPSHHRCGTSRCQAGSFRSSVSYLMVFEDASAPPPSSSFILLGMSAIFNRYRYISPPPPLAFTASASIEEHIVLATRCNQFHSDTLWVVFLKCNSSFFRIQRRGWGRKKT